MDFKGTGILFHCVHIPCEKKPYSRGLFPWMEVNSGRPLVISVTVGVALGLWEVRFIVSQQLATHSQY